jgi:hypothetical protein
MTEFEPTFLRRFQTWLKKLRGPGPRLFKPQTALFRWRGLRGDGSKSGDGQTLGTGVVLGEPGFVLGERGRRDRFGARRGESLFSRERRKTQMPPAG